MHLDWQPGETAPRNILRPVLVMARKLTEREGTELPMVAVFSSSKGAWITRPDSIEVAVTHWADCKALADLPTADDLGPAARGTV